MIEDTVGQFTAHSAKLTKPPCNCCPCIRECKNTHFECKAFRQYVLNGKFTDENIGMSLKGVGPTQ